MSGYLVSLKGMRSARRELAFLVCSGVSGATGALPMLGESF